jgi:hypothetical protein
MLFIADLCERNGGEGAPVVADGLVPEHPLLPHLQQQPRVQVSHLAAINKDENLNRRQLFWMKKYSCRMDYHVYRDNFFKNGHLILAKVYLHTKRSI